MAVFGGFIHNLFTICSYFVHKTSKNYVENYICNALFLPTFSPKSGHLPTFFGQRPLFSEKYLSETRFCPLFAHFSNRKWAENFIDFSEKIRAFITKYHPPNMLTITFPKTTNAAIAISRRTPHRLADLSVSSLEISRFVLSSSKTCLVFSRSTRISRSTSISTDSLFPQYGQYTSSLSRSISRTLPHPGHFSSNKISPPS